MNTAFRFLFCLLTLVLGGCVFPTHLADEAPFGDEVTEFIEPGTTTKSDVRAQLGDPYLESSGGQWWVFPANRRMTEWFVFMCGPYGPCSGGDCGGDVHQYNLIIEFGNDDIVRGSVVVTDQHPCTEDQSICFGRNELTVTVSGTPLTYSLDPRSPLSPDSRLDSEVTLRDGKIYEIGASEPFTGRVVMLDHLGFPQWDRTYKKGELSGIETFWYESGLISYQANYSSNLRNGLATYWNSDGSISSQTCYRNGVIVDLPIDECHP